MDKFIRIRKWPTEHADNALAAGFYIEAIQILHGWIEVKLRELIMLSSTNKRNEHYKSKRVWDLTNELSLNDLSKVLYISAVIDEATLNDVIQFNKVRNKIIHKMFHDPYDDPYEGVPIDEYMLGYNKGKYLSDYLQELSDKLVM